MLLHAPEGLLPEDPHTLNAGEFLEIYLEVGDDLVSAGASGFRPRATLCLQAEALTDAGDVSITFNGNCLTCTGHADVWATCTVNPQKVKKGLNRIEIAHNAPGGDALILCDLQLWIEYD